jgi:demethylmenaquinone methyltransferase/2-methoxy-6-polyprenyl-1,4-benzoquinol methylase
VRESIYELNKPENRKQKEKYVKDTFNSISSVYDRMNGLMSFGMHIYWRKYAVDELRIGPGERVLDGCCGTADFALESARKVGEKGRVVATDFSEGMLREGAEKIRKGVLSRKNTSPALADTMYLPFQSDCFDAVTVGCGIRNLSNLRQGLEEIHRVLKNGGRFGCLDLGRPTIPIYSSLYYLYFFKLVPLMGKLVFGDEEPYAYLPNSLKTFPKQEDLKAMIQEAGFKNVRYKNLAGGAMALHIGEK